MTNTYNIEEKIDSLKLNFKNHYFPPKEFEDEYFRINRLNVDASPWDVLGVSRDSDKEEVRKNYFRIMSIIHPDKIEPYWKNIADKLSARVNSAYEYWK